MRCREIVARIPEPRDMIHCPRHRSRQGNRLGVSIARVARESDRLTLLPARDRTDDPHGP